MRYRALPRGIGTRLIERSSRRVESEGEIRNAEFRMRRRDGQQVVILENARAVRDAANRIVGYEGRLRTSPNANAPSRLYSPRRSARR